MDKNEILAKSREENKGVDLAQTALMSRDNSVNTVLMMCFAFIFCFVQSVSGGGFNFGFFALGLLPSSIYAITRAQHKKTKWNIFCAIVQLPLVLFMSFGFVCQSFGILGF